MGSTFGTFWMAQQKLSLLKEKSAFVLGYTGEVGKELVRELLEKKIFKKVYLFGRRQVEYSNPIYENAVSNKFKTWRGS